MSTNKTGGNTSFIFVQGSSGEQPESLQLAGISQLASQNQSICLYFPSVLYHQTQYLGNYDHCRITVLLYFIFPTELNLIHLQARYNTNKAATDFFCRPIFRSKITDNLRIQQFCITEFIHLSATVEMNDSAHGFNSTYAGKKINGKLINDTSKTRINT